MYLDLTDKTSNANDLINNGCVAESLGLPFADSSVGLKLVSADNNFLSVLDSPTLRIAGPLTIEFWIKTSGISQEIFQSYSQNSNVAGVSIEIVADGRIRAYIGNNTGLVPGVNWQQIISGLAYNDGLNHHVGFVYDGAQLRLFVDNVVVTPVPWTINPVYATTNYVRLGCQNLNGTNGAFLDAVLDDFRIWSIPKSVTEINNNKSIELLGSEAGLNAYWPFEFLTPVIPSISVSPLEFLASHTLSIYHFLRAGDTENYETLPTVTGIKAQILPAGTDIVVFYPDIPAYQLWDIFIFDTTTIKNGDKLIDENANEYIVKGVSFKVNESYMTYQRIAGQKIT